jgi:hypothetical protein
LCVLTPDVFAASAPRCVRALFVNLLSEALALWGLPGF